MNKQQMLSQTAKNIGYELAFEMQNRRKLFQFNNMLINLIAETNPKALLNIAKMLTKGQARINIT